jgi:hypothetical protein
MKILSLAVLALALPMAVFAGSSVGYTNSGGTLAGSNSGLTLTGSTLVAVNGFNGGGLITGNDLGSVSLSTDALMSGSLQTGGTFAAGGSLSGGITKGVVPEPGSLSLMGTGLIGLAGVVRVKPKGFTSRKT